MDPYSRAPKKNTSHGNEGHISYKDHVINEEVRAKKNAYKQTPIPSEESTFSSKTAVGIFAGRLPRLANTIALGNVFYSVSRMEETVGN